MQKLKRLQRGWMEAAAGGFIPGICIIFRPGLCNMLHRIGNGATRHIKFCSEAAFPLYRAIWRAFCYVIAFPLYWAIWRAFCYVIAFPLY